MSSPATLLSVVCFGLQDTRLLSPRGQPDIKNYVKVLKKTTRWAAQWIRVDFDGQPNFGKRNTCTLPRKAEMLTQVTLVTTMPDIATPQINAKKSCSQDKPFIGPTYGWTNSLGHSIINLLELDIGGVNVDTMDGRFLEVYDELYESESAIRAKNRMINRVANGFNSTSLGQDPANPTTSYINLPFWFSTGNYENALPIDALSADAIQISVTLRPVNQLYYTQSRIDMRNPGFDPNRSVSGAMCPLQNGIFYRYNQNSDRRIYSTDPNTNQTIGISGEIIPNVSMPNAFNLGDTYLLCEYISLEEAEAVALRSTQLEYRVDQHYIVSPQNTQYAPNVRIRLPYSNPVKELIWFAQNPIAQNYNAWFLFTRKLYGSNTNPASWWKIPWWPDAILTSANQSRPAFRYAYSEPIRGAQLTYSNIVRFNHQTSPSLFRSLLPILHYRKAPLFNRYIYVYPFALAPGATDDDSLGPSYNPRGLSNWDKLPKIELQLTMEPDTDGMQQDLTIYSYVTIQNIFRVFGGRGVMLFNY